MTAVHVERAHHINVPGSTRSMADHPLFQRPGALLSGYADSDGGAAENYPAARRVHASTIKLPVWHREQDLPFVNAYAAR
ncbi:hypothetical protein [Streptomyces sp. NPDC048638]|uniref:hypothetical protein n=1 Tax=Streptomyces sp. NPDC048638 TaxID=3365580 RepID=UPI00371C143A